MTFPLSSHGRCLKDHPEKNGNRAAPLPEALKMFAHTEGFGIKTVAPPQAFAATPHQAGGTLYVDICRVSSIGEIRNRDTSDKNLFRCFPNGCRVFYDWVTLVALLSSQNHLQSSMRGKNLKCHPLFPNFFYSKI
jgi:hypothetical protein